jgi:hypothetical protein
MVVTTIFTYFLNSVVISLLFTSKFWIKYLEYIQSDPNFYFVIAGSSVHIERYLGG